MWYTRNIGHQHIIGDKSMNLESVQVDQDVAVSKEIDVPKTPAERLPDMSERERIDMGYVHISHATRHLFPRNDV